MLLHITNSSQWGNRNLFYTPHCQLSGVGLGMRLNYLYMWHPLFQAHWDDHASRLQCTYIMIAPLVSSNSSLHFVLFVLLSTYKPFILVYMYNLK